MKNYYKASMVTWRDNDSDWDTVWVEASNLEEAIAKLETQITVSEECEGNMCYRNGIDIHIEISSTEEILSIKGLTSNGFSPELRPEYTTRNGLVWVHKKKTLTAADREQCWVF